MVQMEQFVFSGLLNSLLACELSIVRYERGAMTNKGQEHTIEVPGVPPQFQSQVKKDIAILLNMIEVVADAKGKQFLLHKICVTDCFEDDVNQVLSQQSGLTGFCRCPKQCTSDCQDPVGTLPARKHQLCSDYRCETNRLMGTQESDVSYNDTPRVDPRAVRRRSPQKARSGGIYCN